MRTATFPASDDIVTFRDQIRGAPEVQIRESPPKIRHEVLDVLTTTPGFVKRVAQQHVGSSDLIDDAEVAGFAPEIREPTANDCFVVLFDGHCMFLSIPMKTWKRKASERRQRARSASCP